MIKLTDLKKKASHKLVMNKNFKEKLIIILTHIESNFDFITENLLKNQ